MRNTEKLYVDCDCHTEGCCIEADMDYKEFSMAYYQYSFAGTSYNWKSKLKHIWHILSTGRPYTDMVMFPPEKALKIAEFIEEKSKAMGVSNSPVLTIRKLADENSAAFTVTSNSKEKSELEEAFKTAMSAVGL